MQGKQDVSIKNGPERATCCIAAKREYVLSLFPILYSLSLISRIGDDFADQSGC